jgi:hypothetical protein
LVFTLPSRCVLDPAHLGNCIAAVAGGFPDAAAAGTTGTVTSPGVAKPAIKTARAGSATVAPPAAPVTAPGLIAGTFQQLQNAAKAAPSSGSSSRAQTVARANGPASALVSASPNSPSTRLVSTTVVHAAGTPGTDGMPIFETAPQPATAQPVAVPLAPLPAAVTATASAQPTAPVAAQPITDPVPLPPPNRAAASASPAAVANTGSVSVVNGGGVTVRSGPSKSKSQLFALGPGQKVTVESSQKGWLEIVDAKGRHGWAYSSYFSKH